MNDSDEWWRVEANRHADEEVQRALDVLGASEVELDNWHKDCLAGALSAIFNGLYTLSVKCSQDALLTREERADGAGIVLDPDIAKLDLNSFRRIQNDAKHYPIVRPTFGKL